MNFSIFGLSTKKQLVTFWSVLAISILIFIAGIIMILTSKPEPKTMLSYTPYYVDFDDDCYGWAIVFDTEEIKVQDELTEKCSERIRKKVEEIEKKD